jgi:hypothetical protein
MMELPGPTLIQNIKRRQEAEAWNDLDVSNVVKPAFLMGQLKY